MPEKKRVVKPKPRKSKKPKSEPKIQVQQSTTKKTKQKQKQQQSSNQNVNVKIHVGDKSSKSEKSSSESSSKRPPYNSTPTIIPQYISSLPPPSTKEPEQPRRFVNSYANPVRPNPIMTSLQSLDSASSLPFSSFNFSNPRPNSPASSISSLSMPSLSRSDLTDYFDLEDLSSRSVRSYPSYAVSEPMSSLQSEPYSYSDDSLSVSSSKYANRSSESSELKQDVPMTLFPMERFLPISERKYSDYENISRKSNMAYSPPTVISADDDGTIQMLNEDFGGSSNRIIPFEEPIDKIIAEEKKKRGRPSGQKNRPKEEIEQEKRIKEERKLKKMVDRTSIFREPNRYDKLKERLLERDRLRNKFDGNDDDEEEMHFTGNITKSTKKI